MKLTPSGSRIYIVQYRPKGQNAKTRRYTIGRHDDPWKTEAARNAAADLLAEVRLGKDPFEADRKARREEAAAEAEERDRKERAKKERFEVVVADFICRYAKPKNRRWQEAERVLNSSDLNAWKSRSISTFSKRDIVELMDKVVDRSPASARLLFAHLRKFFNWCVGRLLLSISPLTGLKGPDNVKARDRVLTDAEVVLVWKAADSLSAPFGALIRMLLLTGQRRDEVTSMRWSEVEMQKAEWIIPADRAKNGQSHSVDLSAPALAILGALQAEKRAKQRPKKSNSNPGETASSAELDLVFTTNGRTCVSGHSKAKVALDEAIAALRREDDPELTPEEATLPPWRIHDLRRTAATGMARLGFAPHVVEAVLNHRSGVRGGLVAVYQHYDHRPERKQALEAWATHVSSQVSADPAQKHPA